MPEHDNLPTIAEVLADLKDQDDGEFVCVSLGRLREALAAETERCARIADSYAAGWAGTDPMAGCIADEIRSKP